MDKKYIPKDIEKKIYSKWESNSSFKAPSDPNNGKETYCIMIPPPNVTGNLHMGHALNNTLQDILIRFNRMMGKDVLWQPGTDHAGIATQMVVERKLNNEQKITKESIGRGNFINEIWKWREDSGGQIINQLKRLGSSCDWSRERFTLDEGLSKSVIHVFNKLYDDGLIYKDKRLVNWDPKFKTAISDLEVQQKEIEGNLWYINYKIEGNEKNSITVATTRPETMLGDTAIAVNPEDQKLKHFIGMKAIIPLSGRTIPIIGDDYAKLDEGTGAVKITPAHDFNDFEVGKRNNLEMINIFDISGHLLDDDYIPSPYKKMERFDARKKILFDLDSSGYLVKTEKHIHSVPHGDRSGVVVEPYLTDQWYVDAKKLSINAIKAVKDKKTKFVPSNWEKTYFEWMDNIQPWCISRQLWWGHQIPVWYGPDDKYFVAVNEDEAQVKANEYYGKTVVITREEDVLDTWFSSALWPFSTLGWPENTPEYNKYYNTDVLVTGFDIIFFWVARMMMMGLYFTNQVPFHTIYIHALVRDEQGQKMSKSKGNVIDPLNLIESYGADSLRFTLSSMAAQGRDIKLSESRIEGYRNFITKIWNVARFIHTNNIEIDNKFDPKSVKQDVNKWVINELDTLNKNIRNSLDAFKFNDASSDLYKFTWHLYCDWYIEIIKDEISNNDKHTSQEAKQTLVYTFGNLLKICHPFIPFVTEEINGLFDKSDELLISSSWPLEINNDSKVSKTHLDYFINLISEIRSVRSELKVSPSNKIKLLILDQDDHMLKFLKENIDKVKRIGRLSDVEFVDDIPNGTIQFNIVPHSFALDLKGLVDIDKELDRLNKELNKLSIELLNVEKKLSNQKFIQNAPAEIIKKQKNILVELQIEQSKITSSKDKLLNLKDN